MNSLVQSQCISERSTDIPAVSVTVNIVCRVKAGKEGEEALISPTRNRRGLQGPSQLCSRGRRSRSLICRISRLPCRALPRVSPVDPQHAHGRRSLGV